MEEYIKKIVLSEPQRLVFSRPRQQEIKRVEIKRTERGYTVVRYTERQVIHENIPTEWFYDTVRIWFECFSQLTAFSAEYEYRLARSKKGKPLFSRSRLSAPKVAEPQGQDRQKNYIIEEGKPVPVLVDMGIFTKEGKVVRQMYDKFRQINRFTELIADALTDWDREKTIRVIDFGCGKSYLTFILYHYLTEIRGFKADMTGLDLKADVIEKCNAAAGKYGYDGLHFEVGNIDGYKNGEGADMVISLHACDTATDFALANAVKWGTKMIFSVPCCQHELNFQMKSDELSILTRYGIVKERTAALFTDAIRANMLEYCGYRTQLLEFVDFAHTPKNILIRAVKKQNNPDREKYLSEVQRLMTEFNLDPTIYRLLYERNTENGNK